MTNRDLARLVKYTAAVPNRTALIIAIVAGWVIIATSAIAAAMLLIQSWNWWSNSHSEIEPPRLADWLIVGTVFVVGVVIVVQVQKKYRKYFIIVRQGYVMARDSSGGGDYGLSWCIKIYGYTYANELRYYWCYVNAGDWHDIKKGQLVDYR